MANAAYTLVIRAPNGDVREVPLVGLVVLGRDESADVRVEDKKVSRRHAAFKLVDGKPHVEDLGSSNGVRVDGARIAKRTRIDAQSEVRVGGYIVTLEIHHPRESDATGALELDALPGMSEGTGPMVRSVPRRGSGAVSRVASSAAVATLIGLDPPVEGERFLLRPGENVIGRLGECEVAVLHNSVSRQHARIVAGHDHISIVDLGSSNGVFVEGRRAESAELAHGDRIRIGDVHFRLEHPGLDGRPRPALGARVQSPPRQRAGTASLVLGALGLLLAVGALAVAVSWKRSGGLAELVEGWAGNTAPSSAVGPTTVGPKPASSTVGPKPAPTPSSPPAPVQPTASAKAVSGAAADTPPSPAPVTPVPASPSAPSAERAAAGTSPPTTGRTRTATAPWSPRGPDGLPRGLPAVDPGLDVVGRTTELLSEVKTAMAAHDGKKARSLAESVLALDPIHGEAKAALSRLAELEAADAALERAGALVASGEVAEAYAILSEVPLDLPQAEAARARGAELQKSAIEDALDKARSEATRTSGWRSAHRRYRLVLDLDPRHPRALEGLRALERKMRKRKMGFDPWRPPESELSAAVGDGTSALVERYGPTGAHIVETYVRGEPKSAERQAERRAARTRGAERRQMRQLADGIAEVQRRFGRARREVANDPARAWALLSEIEEVEKTFLPEGLRSYLVAELRADISDAYAKQGESMYDTERYQAAFRSWEAGFKLDPTNARVRAGLERLERVAKELVTRARVASMRGSRQQACDELRLVTQLTRTDADIHREARKQARTVCP